MGWVGEGLFLPWGHGCIPRVIIGGGVSKPRTSIAGALAGLVPYYCICRINALRIHFAVSRREVVAAFRGADTQARLGVGQGHWFGRVVTQLKLFRASFPVEDHPIGGLWLVPNVGDVGVTACMPHGEQDASND